MIINTGIPRSVVGHTISGSIIGAMVSGVYEYSKYKKGEVSKSEAINTTLKATLEGGIIAATNALGNPAKKPLSNALEAMSYVALGVAGVYGIQQAFKQNSQNFTTRRVNDKSTKSK